KGDHILEIAWRMNDQQYGRLTLNTDGQHPLIEQLGIGADSSSGYEPIVKGADPVLWIIEGTRQPPVGVPDEQFWQTFFDSPDQRPHVTHRSRLTNVDSIEVQSYGTRAEIRVGQLVAGSFSGCIQFTCHLNTPLVRIEALVTTKE